MLGVNLREQVGSHKSSPFGLSSCASRLQTVPEWNLGLADRLRSKHMRRLLEEHEYVLQIYWAQRFGEGQGGERKGNKGVKRRIGGEVVI